MISFLIKHKKSILIITLAFFLGSIIYIGLDAYSRSNYSVTAATVGRKKISYRDLYRLSDQQANRLRSQGLRCTASKRQLRIVIPNTYRLANSIVVFRRIIPRALKPNNSDQAVLLGSAG